MNEEEKKEYEELKSLLYTGTISQYGKRKLIEIIEKKSKEIEEMKKQIDLDNECEIALNSKIMDLEKEIEELKREKETNQQMIHLAETQVLGYGQGYKDGLNKETTATAIVARERENQIIYEGMKHKINMQWVLKIKAKIEEIDNMELCSMRIPRLSTLDERLGAKIGIKYVLQSLLEKE